MRQNNRPPAQLSSNQIGIATGETKVSHQDNEGDDDDESDGDIDFEEEEDHNN